MDTRDSKIHLKLLKLLTLDLIFYSYYATNLITTKAPLKTPLTALFQIP